MLAILLSFTSTLDRVADGSLTEKDLGEAIFCFGCTQGWPFVDATQIIRDHRKYQTQSITPEHIEKVRVALKKATEERRVVWRKDTNRMERSGSVVQMELNEALKRRGLFPLNPNLPPIIENEFLRTAIERVDKTRSIQIVG